VAGARHGSFSRKAQVGGLEQQPLVEAGLAPAHAQCQGQQGLEQVDGWRLSRKVSDSRGVV
jgi:hypothetical protein